MGPENSGNKARRTRKGTLGPESTLRGIVIGVVPLALLGVVAAMVMFYPEEGDPAPARPPLAGAAQPPVDQLTPKPLPTAELFLPGPTAEPTRTVGVPTARGSSRAGAPPHPESTAAATVARPRPSLARQVSRQVSDLTFVRAINFWGPVERDTSNGEKEAGDGRTMRIEGQRFSSGLGVHAPSQVDLDLGGRCTSLSAFIGLDDEEGSDPDTNVGAVVFSVVGDGRTLYRSPVVYPDDGPRRVAVGIGGVDTLSLYVDDLASTKNDHADWAAAAVRCNE